MGHIESTSCIVSNWGEVKQHKDITGNRFDLIDLQPGRKMQLTHIGVCRPIQGAASVQVQLLETRTKKEVYEETFDIQANFLDHHVIKKLKDGQKLSAGRQYQILVKYTGASCYTYKENELRICQDEFEIQLARNIDDDKSELNTYDHRMNLITDLGFHVFAKGRECC